MSGVAIDGPPNLLVVDEAFGPACDLYVDVLGVQPNASAGQIQNAYFDRRDDLFRYLNELDAADNVNNNKVAASQRLQIERQLDGVVVAVRILGDSELRRQYDDLRSERLQGAHNGHAAASNGGEHLRYETTLRKKQQQKQQSRHGNSRSKSRRSESSSREEDRRRSQQQQQQQSSRRTREHRESAAAASSSKLNRSLDSTPSDEGLFGASSGRSKKNKSRVVTPEQQPPPRKSRMPLVHEEDLNMSLDETVTTAMTFDDCRTVQTYASQGTMVTHQTDTGATHILGKIQTEITDTIQDTQTTFEQVFSVFTLRDEDIMAVTGRIDRAKRQVSRNLTHGPTFY